MASRSAAGEGETKTRPCVLLVQPTIEQPGGGSAVAAWMIEALKESHDVTVLLSSFVDAGDLNRLYGTSLSRTDFAQRRVPLLMRAAARLEPHPYGAQRTAWVIRAAKSIRRHYDVVVTAQNELDLGGPAIQYVHHPVFDLVHRRLQTMHRPPWRKALWTRVWYRYRPWWLISGFSFERMKRNLTLVNSGWTGRVVHRIYGIPTTTLYPPTAGVRPGRPWEEREPGFVSIGRFVPEKNFPGIIDILAAVRATAPDVHLHIVGVRGRRPGDDACYEEVRRAAQRHRAWVHIHEDLSRNEVADLLGRHRFGIHGMEDEHYGMAVAEMISARCIPFVPDSGGPVEIVAAEERLRYASATEAVDRINAVLRDDEQQAELRRRLGASPAVLPAERFAERFREIVETFRAGH